MRLDGPLEPEAPSGTGAGQAKPETDELVPGGDSSSPEDESGRKPNDEPADADPAEPGGNRLASGEHCCFNGTYLRCPSAAACFGGFDVNDCLSKCADLGCIQACTDKLGTAGAPKGCAATAAPPVGVDCANGQIGL